MPSVQHGQEPICAGCPALARVEELQREIKQLHERLEQVEREAHRQAAPFRRPEEKRKKDKGKPGRPKGHAPAYRPPPPQVDEEADVPLACCPHCQGPVHHVRAVEQIIEDLPPVRVHRLRLVTYRGHCPQCGEVRSTHPAQVSTAVGAAGTHLGKNALALAADLSKHYGLTMSKVTALLRDLYGLSLTRGGLSQALDRTADRMAGAYEQLREALRRGGAIHADETGWWVEGHSAWLWVFANPQVTLYVIADRSQQTVRLVVGDDYGGVLVSDCLSSYDPHPGRKSKCCAHHLKAIKEALLEAPESRFLHHIRSLLRAAIALHEARSRLAAPSYERYVQALEQWLDRLLAEPHGHAAEVRVANRLRKHRAHLLTFLHVAGVAPTNNLAERQLRPAVITRKLSCGNKTTRGQRTFEILCSLAATCAQQGQSFRELIVGWLSMNGPPDLLLDL
jgi:transposase